MSAPRSLPELYERYVAAWAAHDPDAIVALHAPETTFWLHHGQPAVEGSGAVRDAFAAMFAALPDFGFVIHRTEFGPHHWVLDWTLTSRLPTGEPAQWDCIDLVTVTDDWRVARKDTFLDGVQFERALAG
ncbi:MULTISPECIES: nuclear transport factor 2 family protein [unclassified Mycobacterium]|uniref:nuclear transport factor 2 family protein n=1 Tax=unclassified Mycobacterium TaxID=2642494 RepID=UPI0029C7EA2B|nr:MULTISPECIES: nuclear transport factor 2 family protein [unclassified Mycobacterium]